MIGDYNRVSSTTLIPDMVDRLSDFQAQVFVKGIWRVHTAHVPLVYPLVLQIYLLFLLVEMRA